MEVSVVCSTVGGSALEARVKGGLGRKAFASLVTSNAMPPVRPLGCAVVRLEIALLPENKVDVALSTAVSLAARQPRHVHPSLEGANF